MNLYDSLDKVMCVKRTYTIVRVYRPLIPDNHAISQVFDEDEIEAQREFIRLAEEAGLEYDVETIRPEVQH